MGTLRLHVFGEGGGHQAQGFDQHPSGRVLRVAYNINSLDEMHAAYYRNVIYDMRQSSAGISLLFGPLGPPLIVLGFCYTGPRPDPHPLKSGSIRPMHVARDPGARARCVLMPK
jgi:hypothetical protein